VVDQGIDAAGRIRLVSELLANGDLVRARAEAQNALELARRGDSLLELEDALIALAAAHERYGDPMPGLSAALEGAQLADRRRDAVAKARFLALAGAAYIELCEPADALVVLEQAMASMEGCNDPHLEVKVLHLAGWAMKEVGRARAGRDLALRAVERAAGPEHDALRADALVSLGDIECEIAAKMPPSDERSDALRRALDALAEAERLAQVVGARDYEARALGNSAAALALAGSHKDAIAVQQRALGMMLENSDVSGAIEAYLRLGRSERALGRLEDARGHIRLSLKLASDHNAKLDMARAHEELALLAAEDAEYEAAYRHLALARKLELELAGDHAVRSAELMALRLATEESSREAAQLREQSRTLTELTEQLARERETFARQALVDPLTGLANRRALEHAVDVLERDAPRAGATVAVADIDHFKEINDRFGHAVGDEVLRAVAAVLERFARREDLVCRYGGEEFVLLLGSSDRRAARSITERIRAAIEGHRWGEVASGLTVTISIGVAAGSATEMNELLRTADRLLYRAKRAGRNRVEHPGDERRAA
jgi:diguanylate cyclase (GGDEF)-like protein